jgi:hypothetical protein
MPRVVSLRAAVIAVAGLVLLSVPGLGTKSGAMPRSLPPLGTPTSTSPVLTSWLTWTASTPGVIAESSPVPAEIDGVPAVVVGSRGGEILALDLDSGTALPGWPVTVPGSIPVDSTPSIDGSMIYVGIGNAGTPSGGGYLGLHSDGSPGFFTQVGSTPKAPHMAGVMAGLSVGYLQGVKTVTAGSLGQYAEELNAASGQAMTGFPWFSSDTEFSTPSIANLYGTGRNYIVSGAEQTAGNAFRHQYPQGGHLRVLSETGNAGTNQPGGGVICDFTPDQGVASSPAVGRFLAGNAVGIVVGTSTDWPGASDTDALFALNPNCGVMWRDSLDGSTADSPALVDALGDGRLQVAEGAITGKQSATVYLLNGSDGATDWTQDVSGMIIGSITSADLGSGYQDLLVPTTTGLFILDGRTGTQLAHIAVHLGLQSSPLVTDDADGLIGVTLAGYGPGGGLIWHFEFAGPGESPTDGSLADEAGAWPMFHHDPQLTGTTLTALGPPEL